jgi:hypothetical protein
MMMPVCVFAVLCSLHRTSSLAELCLLDCIHGAADGLLVLLLDVQGTKQLAALTATLT